MADFGSAVLVAAVRRALAAEGVAVAAPRSRGALLPLEAKRRFLTGIVEKYGLLSLLSVGLSLGKLPPDPAVTALAAACDALELFDRWNRLARFTHSRHRVEVREVGVTHLVAEHVALTGAPPEPADDVLILGVLGALLTAIGAQGVTVALDPSDPVVVFSENCCIEPPAGLATALWRFDWSSMNPGSRPITFAAGTDLISRARRMIASDLTRNWSLADLAAEFDLSTRSLQRRLDDCGGFSTLLGATRAEAAGDLLINSEHSLYAVGFGCGYVDQPHLTREFKRYAAMTPAAYRAAFARPSDGARPDSTLAAKGEPA